MNMNEYEKVEKLTNLVITLKTIECCNSYDEFYDKYNEIDETYDEIDNALNKIQYYETFLKYEDARKELIDEIEEDIIIMLKENI